MADLRDLTLRRNNLEIDRELILANLATARARQSRNLPGATAEVNRLTAELAQIDAQLATLNFQIRQLQSPTASAGNLVNDDARATAEGARSQSPTVPPEILNDEGRITVAPDTVSATNALTNNLVLDGDEGTDDPVRTLTNTQSTTLGDNEQGGRLLLDPALDGREEFDGSPAVSTSVGGQPGFGAGSDDSGSKNLTRVEIDNVFSETKIVPQPNVLDQYASYTYVASLYLMSATDYREMVRTKQKNLRGAQLLIQSGGAAVGGRNEFFSNDYYIDRIEIHSAVTGKGTNAAHNANKIKLTVVEPNGITLVNNLDRAVQQYLGSADAKKKTFTSQMYLLVIRFYGYDDKGTLVRGGVPKPDGSSDPNAFVEKWYPMQISKIDFKIANKLVEYEIEGAAFSYTVSAGSNRGTIPYNVELSGISVKDAISGPAQYVSNTITGGIELDDQDQPLLPEDAGLGGTTGTVNSAPAKASAAPSKKTTIRQGLMSALNEYQESLVRQGIYTYPDRYSIEFVNSALEQALIKNKGSTDKSKISNSTSKNAADQKVGAKQSADTNSKIINITAGSQIVQVLDQIVRNSSYIEDQQIVIFDPNTQKQIPNGTAADNLAYFKITLQASPTRYDPKRNDYAYDIKYIVHFYRINEAGSNYFFVPTFKGVHKQYNYWFTGENTSVLNYEQSLNTMYTSVLSGGSSSPATLINDAIKFNFQPRSGESSQGADGKVNETKANLADYLFNPGDYANVNLTIVGDPAWLQQGEAFAGIRKTDPYFFRSFLADGTINFESQQITFEVLFNSPRDYDLNTGLIDPNQQTTYFLNGRQPGAARQSAVYRASDVISLFDRGKFTQTLKGSLLTYYPDQTFKANQQITADLQRSVIQSLAANRNNLTGAIVGSLTSPAFLNNIPGISGIVAAASSIGINPAQTVGRVTSSILGSDPTRTSSVPSNPTSFGLNIGLSSINGISVGTPPLVGRSTVDSTNEVLAIPENDLLQATVVGTEQTSAAGDDSGIGTNLQSGIAGNDLNDFFG